MLEVRFAELIEFALCREGAVSSRCNAITGPAEVANITTVPIIVVIETAITTNAVLPVPIICESAKPRP